jgi:hypothetical protein
MPISTIGSNSLNQTSDLTINGQTVGKGGGNVATNTAHGISALNGNSSGTGVTAIGSSALPVSTASNNTAVGRVAGNSTTSGSDNTFMGMQSGYSNVTGSSNVYVGVSAGYSATGSSNTLIGQGSGELISSGTKNTILGRYNGNQGGIDIRTSSNNIVLSDGDGGVKQWWNSTGYWEYTNNTQLRLPSTGGTGYIGYLADSSSIQVSYNSTGNGVRLTSGATSWSTWSDQRLKNVTGTYTTPLADISQLQPIKFTWKSDEENKPQVGILAQSVQPVVPEAVEEGTISLEDETKYLTVRYTELIPLMVASIKELKTIVDAQAAEIAELKAKVA